MRRLVIAAVILLPAGAAEFDTAVTPFVKSRCVMCHNAKMRSGELDLQHHSAPEHALKDRDVWESVVQKLKSGEMPPKGLPRPKPEEVARVTGFIEREYERQDRNAKPDPGRVTARRLNRAEYNNTVRDLIGIDFGPADDFPADDSGYGFDNIGDVLSLSPVLMEKYLTAAETIARRAIIAERIQPKATRTQIRAESVGMGDQLKVQLAPGAQGPMPVREALHVRHRFAAEGDYDIRIALGGSRRDQPAVTMGFWIDGKLEQTFPVDPKPNNKRAFDLRVRVPAGEHRLSAALLDDTFDPAKYERKPNERLLAIDLFEIRGPFNPATPPLPDSHRKLLFCGHELNSHTTSCDRTLLTPLVRRAFRRTPTKPEIDRLLKLMDRARTEGDSFESAFRVAVQAILVSPHFLFRIERDPDPTNPDQHHQVSEFELASRLSYFLWSSTPDDELLDLAGSGKLRTQIKSQIRRMIEDPKSSALAENFAGQWLQLRNLDEAKPDPDRFPGFDDQLRRAMKRETELFFEAIVREDRSILEFLDAKFTYLNERLAMHYGIDRVEGNDFRRVELTGDQRGGILTHASVLTVSSYPTRTSPVIRGKWILENILNAPPPPPPPGVPNLDEEAVGNTGSLRQQLEKHRANSVCASCHARMDPLGFGLENYDAIGAWRTKDGKFPIDVAGTLPNGKSFKTPAQLKSILRADKDEFARCVTEKLLTYALGRGLERFDKPAVQSISRQLAAEEYRFSALLDAIVGSMPFGMRRGEQVNEQ